MLQVLHSLRGTGSSAKALIEWAGIKELRAHECVS
jgi:hypothetical protein